MADSEFILGLLENVRKRLRVIRRLQTAFSILAIAFIFPVFLKLVDFVFPLRGAVVATAIAAWGIATAVWFTLRIRHTVDLSSAASSLDESGKLQDQMKTAYWFILHPSRSQWVDALVEKAAQKARTLRLDVLFPAPFPKSSKVFLSLLLLFVTLNFLPISQNHNWFRLQSAPPLRLSRAEQASLERARKLLEHTEAADELEQIVNNLQEGKIASEEAQQQISNLRQQIDSGNLELNNILDGLSTIANQLGQSEALESAAEAISKGDLEKASDEIRDLAEKLDGTPSDLLRELERNLGQAAASSPAALQSLSKPMQQASDALKNSDTQAGQAALDGFAQALEQLAEKLQNQQRQSQASQQLADLQNALQQEAAAESASDSQQTPSPSQGGARGNSGDAAANGTPATGNSSGIGQGTAGGKSTGAALGTAEESKPTESTKLDVQLKMEGLKGQSASGGQLQDIEEASRQERSLLDYRNVPSQLSPAQKDALNQNRLPREQREIVKYYFEEIRPQSSGPAKP